MTATLRKAAAAVWLASLFAACNANAKPYTVKSIEPLQVGSGNLSHSAVRNEIAIEWPDSQGVHQVYIALPDGKSAHCLTCKAVAGGPRSDLHKGAPTWHRSGDWIVMSVEMPQHPGRHRDAEAGAAFWTNLWAVSTDGGRWIPLTNYPATMPSATPYDQPRGALIPRLSPYSDKLVWGETIGYDRAHPFGVRRLAIADFIAEPTPHLGPIHTASPGGGTFFEPWSFSPGDQRVLVASDAGLRAGSIAVNAWDPRTEAFTRLVNFDAPVFSEQAAFSPDGTKIAFMSTHGVNPRYDPRAFGTTFQTEVWLMNADGSAPERLTHFTDAPRPGTTAIAIPVTWSSDGHYLYFGLTYKTPEATNLDQGKLYRIEFER